MPTYSALTTLHGAGAAEALGAALERLDPAPVALAVIEIEDGSGQWEVGAHFLEPPDTAGLALVAAAFGAPEFTTSEIPERDWVAHVRRELAPVRAGRYFLHGAHDADKVPEGTVALRIEAAMAFGTGHHGTTLGCLRMLDRIAAEGANPGSVADIGCGTAVLAIAAAKTWAEARILASDIDAVAVEVAAANAAANGLAGRLQCIEAAGFDHPALRTGAPFGLVFANILKGPLLELAPEIAAATAPGGHAILSGLLTGQAQEVVSAYATNGMELRDRLDIGEWSTLLLTPTAR